jgi:uncharacterized protein YabN with tetrapyrrole methylase and pyrophosphatase domain
MKTLVHDAYEKLKYAEAQGFFWPNLTLLFDNVKDEVREIQDAHEQHESKERLQEEMGDLLLGVVEMSRLLHIDLENALEMAVLKFQQRFQIVEELCIKEGHQNLYPMTAEEKMALWHKAKKIHQNI